MEKETLGWRAGGCRMGVIIESAICSRHLCISIMEDGLGGSRQLWADLASIWRVRGNLRLCALPTFLLLRRLAPPVFSVVGVPLVLEFLPSPSL